MTNRHSDLIRLAQHASSEKRRELMRCVSDIFIDGSGRYTDREIVQFGEVLSLLLDRVTLDARAELSGRVAPCGRTPRDLVMRLANDEASVAAPVLQSSPVLSDDDLVDIAGRKGQDHMMAIAGRAALSERVTDILVDRGGTDVLVRVTHNRGAAFSPKGISMLVEKAHESEVLGEALANCPDVPPVVVERLVSILDPAARERMKTLLAQNQKVLDEVMRAACRETKSPASSLLRNRAELNAMVAHVRRGATSADAALGTLVAERHLLGIAYMLAEVAGVPEPHVSNAMYKVSGTAIAIVCRSVDISDAVYNRLSQLRCERLRLPASQMLSMAREYQQLDRAAVPSAPART